MYVSGVSGIERINFFPTNEDGAEVACKWDENPIKDAKKKRFGSKYFIKKHEQLLYLFKKKGFYRMIKLSVNLQPWDF